MGEYDKVSDDELMQRIENELLSNPDSKRSRAIRKIIFASFGAIPWVGGVISAAASIPDDQRDAEHDQLRTEWLQNHQQKIEDLKKALGDLFLRFDSLGDEINDRIESPEYLSLVRQCFQAWDHAETEEKRKLIGNMLANTAGSQLCSDDVVRLFVSMLDQFHESHFMIIREIHRNPRCTRGDVWRVIHGGRVREDSAEADLFKLLFHDLSTNRVIRQERATTHDGQFLKKQGRSRSRSATMTSAFDDGKPYVLTELGKQFVHYTLMSDVKRLESSNE